MSTTILIDGNSVGYAEQYGTKLTNAGMETQAVFGFIRKMRDIKVGYPGATPMVLWDGRAKWRFDMWPLYKSNRDNDPKKAAIKKAYVAQRPYIARALECLGVRQVTSMNDEADDLAGYFVPLLTENPDNRVVLLTGDHDWMQLVRPGVTWVDARGGSTLDYVSHETLLQKTGYKTPLAFLQGKCLHGDTSDVIPGVGGIGKDSAPGFLAQWDSNVHNFFKAVDSGKYTPQTRKGKTAKTPHPEERLASMEGRKTFLRNLKLMQLLNVRKPDPAGMRIVKGAVDPDKFGELCDELGFMSITSRIDEYIEPFNN